MFLDIQLCEKRHRRYAVETEEMMEGFFDMLNTVLMNVVLVGWALICIGIGLTIVAMMLDAFFGITSLTTKTIRKDTMHNAGAEYNCNTTDEAQHRFISEHIRAHEDGVRLHDMAAREAWDAHTTACDQHQAAVDTHNDFSFGGCDPWF